MIRIATLEDPSRDGSLAPRWMILLMALITEGRKEEEAPHLGYSQFLSFFKYENLCWKAKEFFWRICSPFCE